jgi:Leucine-rich repeat (LRR) protein
MILEISTMTAAITVTLKRRCISRTWELGGLTSLKSLHLSRLTRVPAELGLLSSLTRLDLSKNQLSSVAAEIWHRGPRRIEGVEPR